MDLTSSKQHSADSSAQMFSIQLQMAYVCASRQLLPGKLLQETYPAILRQILMAQIAFTLAANGSQYERDWIRASQGLLQWRQETEESGAAPLWNAT